jgi:bifunctional enzyme CysN/CysC
MIDRHGITMADPQPPRPAEVAADGYRLVLRQQHRSAQACGVTVWLTGLPAAGKTTIGSALRDRLAQHGCQAYLLDGDELRRGLCEDLGFDPAARAENVRRVSHAARLFADAGIIAITALISPYADDRLAARRLHESAGLRFVEVYVNAPKAECVRRDPKGLYARARSGQVHSVTGADAPYEAPVEPDLELRTAEEPVDCCVNRILRLLGQAEVPLRATR